MKKQRNKTPLEVVFSTFELWPLREIDTYFYGDFSYYKRTEEGVIVTLKSGIECPVEDWNKGKKLSGGQIRALAKHFYLQGLLDGHKYEGKIDFIGQEPKNI